jgi:integrase
MELVQPIRDEKQIEDMKRALKKTGTRNYMLFLFGINTGLRISDILKLKVSDVTDKSHVVIREEKTNKTKRIKINSIVTNELKDYIVGMNENDYLFKSQKGENRPITRFQAYRILNDAACAIGINGEIGTHTLRKTFGYHFYQKTKDRALLQELFNHSAPSVTKKYIGLTQDMLDDALNDFLL